MSGYLNTKFHSTDGFSSACPFFRTLASPTRGIIHCSDTLYRPHLQQYLKTLHFKDKTAPVASSGESVNTNCQMDPMDTKLFAVQNSLAYLTHLTVDVSPNLLQGQWRKSKQWMIQNIIHHHKNPTEWLHKIVSWINLACDRKRTNAVTHFRRDIFFKLRIACK